jgi:hypothetical protein
VTRSLKITVQSFTDNFFFQLKKEKQVREATAPQRTADPSASFFVMLFASHAHRHMATAALTRTKAASKSLANTHAKDHANKTCPKLL